MVFGWIFGKKEDKKVDTVKSADKINSAVDLLNKREKVLLKKIEQEKQKAQEFIKAKNRNGA